ncbi:putative type I restriction enzyme EcoR124II, partial [Bacteroides fragilis str. S24L15]
ITDDFTLKGKTTSFESVVKSSKIIQGRFEHIPVASLV